MMQTYVYENCINLILFMNGQFGDLLFIMYDNNMISYKEMREEIKNKM